MRIDTEYLIVPILRAGLGMSPAVQEVLPHHRVCLVGLRRNEVDPSARRVLRRTSRHRSTVSTSSLCDPMLATGGSLICVSDMLRDRGAGEITVLCLIAAQTRRRATCFSKHPDIAIVAAALDEELNDVGYITPGPR